MISKRIYTQYDTLPFAPNCLDKTAKSVLYFSPASRRLSDSSKEEFEMIKKILDNDLFVKENLEELVKKYAHQRIIISRGEIFTGEDAVKKARAKYPKTIPLSMPIPGPEEFVHVL